jgi:hypothetical protein
MGEWKKWEAERGKVIEGWGDGEGKWEWEEGKGKGNGKREKGEEDAGGRGNGIREKKGKRTERKVIKGKGRGVITFIIVIC